MQQEDELSRKRLDGIPERAPIAARIKELLSTDKLESIGSYGGVIFVRKRLGGKDKSVILVRAAGGGERILIDPNSWDPSEGKSLMNYWPSPNGKRVAVLVSNNGSDDSHLAIFDVASGSVVDTIAGAKYDAVAWSADSAGIYFTFFAKNGDSPDVFAGAEVRLHRVASKTPDVVISPKTGEPEIYQRVEPSEDGHWLVLSKIKGWRSGSVWFRDARHSDTWHPLAVGQSAMFSVIARGEHFYVRTNEGAPKWRLFRVSAARPGRDNWEEIVKERTDAILEDATIVGEKLMLRWRHPAEGTEIEMCALDGTGTKKVPLPEIGMASTPNNRENDKQAFFSFESYTHPLEWYRLDTVSGKVTSIDRTSSPIRSSDYAVEIVPYESPDAAHGFMYLVHRKDVQRGSRAPVILYGYGGFSVSLEPAYLAALPAWLERGGIYAEAAVRGGGEFGEDWHRHGTGAEKQHTFDDFIAAAQELEKQGWASPERLGILGSSAGGLLVSGTITQRPDLFRFAIAEASITDMVRYSMTGIGKRWVGELGDPAKPDDFRSLLSYSPYHHVRDGVAYPAMLVLYPEADDRVDPMHSRKFVAALQHATTGGPVWLSVEKGIGHNRPDSRSVIAEVTADMYAFALAQVAGR